jgi:hypothetical protein
MWYESATFRVAGKPLVFREPPGFPIFLFLESLTTDSASTMFALLANLEAFEALMDSWNRRDAADG